MGVTGRIARACARRPRRTLAAWGVAVLLALAGAAVGLSGLTTDSHVTGSPESTRAERLLAGAFPFDPKKAVSDVVVVRSERYTVDAPRFRAFVRELVGEGVATNDVANARVYLSDPDPSLVSADRHATQILLLVPGNDAVKPLVAIARTADASPSFDVAMTGDHVANNDFGSLSQHDLANGELRYGLPAALIVLVLVFGAVVAGLVPLLMAILSIVVALGLVAALAQAFQLSTFIVNMLTGMGLALGVDYSLFVVSRYREERLLGRPKEEAIVRAGATASRAVLFSGSTFVVALLGMLIVPTTIMRSLAAGAILVGIVSVAAALTLLPALLALVGDRVDSLRIPLVGSRRLEDRNPEGRFWGAVVRLVLRRPAASFAGAAALLVALGLPFFGLHIGQNGVSTLPDRLESKQGYLALQRSFPGQQVDPVEVAVPDAGRPAVAAGVRRLVSAVAADPSFGPPTVARSGGVARVAFPVRGDAVGSAASAAVRRLRSAVVPAAFAGAGVRPLVGGKTAEQVDYYDAVSRPAPLVVGFVLLLSFVLLTVGFGSVVVALTAILLNVLSVGAALGLLVLVFQHGWGAGLLGFQHVAVIDAWVPLFLFSVLFGLSMDYQVFLLSRIRERYDLGETTRDAVTGGVATTARIITGAALIIVAVFSGFAAGDLVMFQQMGFGIAVSLLIDATIVRSILLPSLMTLLGDANWYLPRRLAWLPRMRVEGGPDAPPAREPA
ncbi:MAG TPA: MMPL family transporter [Gaiellaceae bacterium]|nr:MMPL family transporter [Gaiellaceae bacterium]